MERGSFALHSSLCRKTKGGWKEAAFESRQKEDGGPYFPISAAEKKGFKVG